MEYHAEKQMPHRWLPPKEHPDKPVRSTKSSTDSPNKVKSKSQVLHFRDISVAPSTIVDPVKPTKSLPRKKIEKHSKSRGTFYVKFRDELAFFSKLERVEISTPICQKQYRLVRRFVYCWSKVYWHWFYYSPNLMVRLVGLLEKFRAILCGIELFR